MNSIRILIILLSGIGIFASCNSDNGKLPADVVHNPVTASGEANMHDLPSLEFKETLHDFGTVIEGEKVTYSFKFKNTGGRDLLISNVSASCGCTATKYTKEAVTPGGEGVITVTFDTHRRRGFQNKSITVSANTQPNKVVLRIKAKVISPNDL
ncbi:MAG: DUF1573 domain-containing protein [Bacteroidales bacterium]|nr:DUF1573 domain-containing protein [Bacteroidales bacterium]